MTFKLSRTKSHRSQRKVLDFGVNGLGLRLEGSALVSSFMSRVIGSPFGMRGLDPSLPVA